MTKILLSITLCFFISNILQAQETFVNQEKYQVHAGRTQEKIKIDGNLEEAIWKTAKPVTGFSHKWPIVGGLAERQTEVRMAFDAQFMYVGVVCYDTSTYIVQSLKRDAGYWDSDGFAMILDPVNGHSNGYFFGINAYGAQSDALVVQNADDMNFDWNDKWEAETKRYPDRWTIEIAIPFKTLRFEQGKSTWGINFVRNDLKNFKYHIWAPVPQQFDGNNLNFTGSLIWDELPQRSNKSISVIPYLSVGIEHDIENNKKPNAVSKVGSDAKIAVSSSLNLDLTFNPDFSQVEVDAQQTNLTRFSLFLPEKRNFFLENSDIFGEYGLPPLRPFFSRTIGLNSDGSSVPIWAGARLTGSLDDKTRIGILNMQTASDGTNDPRNYTAASVQRRVLGNSVLKAMFLNRQGINEKGFNGKDFSRNLGTEFVFTSKNNKWQSWAAYNHSWKNDVKNNLNNSYANAGFGYRGERLNTITDFLRCGDNYYADLGFNQRIENSFIINDRDTTLRLGWYHWYNNIEFSTYTPDNKWTNSIKYSLDAFTVWNLNGTNNEFKLTPSVNVGFKNSSEVELTVSHNRLNLLHAVRFLGENVKALPRAKYTYTNVEASYNSDFRKRLGYNLSAQYGTFYNGTLLQLKAGLNYRIQPWGSFSLNLEQNNIELPAEFGSDKFTLLGLKADISFSKNLLWANYVQYNKQAQVFLINSRFQWRYKPMSDMFVAYTDNYLASDFLPNYRALVFKINYWW